MFWKCRCLPLTLPLADDARHSKTWYTSRVPGSLKHGTDWLVGQHRSPLNAQPFGLRQSTPPHHASQIGLDFEILLFCNYLQPNAPISTVNYYLHANASQSRAPPPFCGSPRSTHLCPRPRPIPSSIRLPRESHPHTGFCRCPLTSSPCSAHNRPRNQHRHSHQPC